MLPINHKGCKEPVHLGVTLLENGKEEMVRQTMIEVFKKDRLPKTIRSDNGSPFACTSALLGLSKLSAWWIRLGIAPNRGRVGCPQDNGAHERMHRDMKKELQAERADRQSEMDEWVDTFNRERPHQALNGDTPAMHYHKSARKYTGSLIEFDYKDMATRIIDKHGDLKWRSMDYFLSEALRGERVGLKAQGKGLYEVRFGDYMLGLVDEKRGTFTPRQEGREAPRVIRARKKQKAVIREFE